MAPRVLEPPIRAGTGISVYPSATAMVWPGEGHAHEAVAVPGVQLGPGEVLVEIELATICSSDVHTYAGECPAPTPLILGHEQVARVVALGQGGAKSTDGHRLAIGSRVVWSVAVPCGRCARCRRGIGQKCLNLHCYGQERMRRGWELSGGFATHAHLLAGTPIVVVPEEIPSAVLAPASCATATVVAALDAASAIAPVAGSLTVIAGAGMLGLTAAAMVSAAGGTVVVLEPDERRRENALAFGARAVADPRVSVPHPSSLASALLRAGGRGATCTIALEMSGSAGAVELLLDTLDVGGVLALVGTTSPGSEVSIDPERLVRQLLTVRGVHNYLPQQLARAVEFLGESWRGFPFADQVGRIVPLASIDEAVALAATRDSPRIGLAPRA